MADRKLLPYRIYAAYDTETTNVGTGAATRAYTVCYQVNTLRDCNLCTYEPGVSDAISIFRDPAEMLAYIADAIAWGRRNECIPVICGYNLMFDLQPLMRSLADRYQMAVNAQSSTNVYTLDIVDDEGGVKLRFWDTYHLEMRGLAAMGETAGLAKATGEWDYTLVRTPDTPLTDKEIYYASRDVQVIPAYLRYLLDANEWLQPDMLGCRVLTKTSIVRNMARLEIGPLRFRKRNGKPMSLLEAFEVTCAQELPRDFYIYALRKASFTGGFTFTAARYASSVVRNVVSLDVTSMHHTFINGRKIPLHFERMRPEVIEQMMDAVAAKSLDAVLKRYHKPFECAFHARVRLRNIRLKRGTGFEHWGIALIPEGKFSSNAGSCEYGESAAARFAERSVRLSGWRSEAVNPVFAFGKLYRADEVVLHVSELEWWNICQVYDFDARECVLGEGTFKFAYAPDYVTLQSNRLFETKSHAKFINNHYEQGEPYAYDIPDTIPAGIAEGLRGGAISSRFFESFYQSTVKGSFCSTAFTALRRRTCSNPATSWMTASYAWTRRTPSHRRPSRPTGRSDAACSTPMGCASSEGRACTCASRSCCCGARSGRAPA